MRKYENVTFWHSDREKIELIASIKVATVILLPRVKRSMENDHNMVTIQPLLFSSLYTN